MKPFNPKPRPCKACSTSFVPDRPMQSVCSPKCAVKKVRQDKAEERAKVKTRKEKSLTPSQRRARAQVAGLPCISCGRFHEGQWHAGHYRSRGAAINLALDPRNIHKQCQPCNTHLHGNAIAYRAGLVERYGLAFVEELEADNTPRHYTDADFDAIRDEYRAKTNELKKERA